MALVDSLLSAMHRAGGDALVMHVGEKPYVVASGGTIELSTHGLNLGAMVGMLQQLLPPEALNSLDEFGAVEHRLPSDAGERITVVAARGGDDIWIEIRRRRLAADAEPSIAAAPAPAPAPVTASAPVDAPASAPAPVAAPVTAAAPAPAPVTAPPPAAVVAQEEPVPDDAPFDIPVDTPLEMPVDEPDDLPVEAPAAHSFGLSEDATIEILPDALEDDDGAADMFAEAPFEVPVEQPVSEPAEEPVPAEAAAAEPAAAELFAPAAEPVAPAAEPDGAWLAAELTTAAAPSAAAPEREAAQATGPSLVLPMTRTVRIEVPPRVSAQARAGSADRLLRLAFARGASALFLITDARPYARVEGDIRPLDGEPPLSRSDVETAVMAIVPPTAQEPVGRGEPTEWITDLPDLGRVRCTSFHDHRGPGVLFSLIATRPATAEQLGLSREVQGLVTEAEGIVVVAGPRGGGKTTLMSALVDLVNRQRAEYVITLERQIRLVHDNRTALVSQREIRGHADEALAAARAALRENPDVLVVDDLVSAPMLRLLLDAAADGILVCLTVTAPSTADALARLIDLMPAEQRAATQAAMGEWFRGGVTQVFLKKAAGGRVAAREVLLATAAVGRMIADGQFGQLPMALESGGRYGMASLTSVLVGLVRSGTVDAREAFRKTNDRDRLVAALKREGVDTAFAERLA